MCRLCVLKGKSLKQSDLPPFDTTFFLPFSEIDDLSKFIDWDASSYLPKYIQQLIPIQIVPLKTTGDGNCLLHAVSRAIYGVELYYELLRGRVEEELRVNQEWYLQCTELTEADWTSSLNQSKQSGLYLDFSHIFALSNVIKRPIIMYASEEDTERFGMGEVGVAATFVPSRHPYTECKSSPIYISWGSKIRNHYVPLIGLEGKPLPELPILKVAFPSQLKDTPVENYLHFSAAPKPPSSAIPDHSIDHDKAQNSQNNSVSALSYFTFDSLVEPASNQTLSTDIAQLLTERLSYQLLEELTRQNSKSQIMSFQLTLPDKILLLSYDRNDSPSDVALKFVEKHSLSPSLLPELNRILTLNASKEYSYLPFIGEKLFYDTFKKENFNFHATFEQIYASNKALYHQNVEGKQWMTDQEREILNVIREITERPSSSPSSHMFYYDQSHLHLLRKLLKWPKKDTLSVLNLMHMMILHENGKAKSSQQIRIILVDMFLSSVDEAREILSLSVPSPLSSFPMSALSREERNLYEQICHLGLFLLVNMCSQDSLFQVLLMTLSIINRVIQHNTHSKNVFLRETLATVYLNLAMSLCGYNLYFEKKEMISILVNWLEHETELSVSFYILLAIGNLAYDDQHICRYLKFYTQIMNQLENNLKEEPSVNVRNVASDLIHLLANN
jgi:hypothetical protein